MTCRHWLLFTLLSLTRVRHGTSTLYPGLAHGDHEKSYVGIVHRLTTFPQRKANKLCEYTGKLLLHPTNRCRYLKCQYLKTSDPGLYAVEQECPLGFHISADLYTKALRRDYFYTGMPPDDIFLVQPCVATTDYNCPKDTPLITAKREGRLK